jgi:antitoxin (DNA-binding transcriptional repressor) of toxin-antitoxin stability system
MATVTTHEAKTNLSKLTARAEAGEEIIIARGKEPVAKLTPLAGGKRRPEFGALKGKLNIPDAFFFEPPPEEESSSSGRARTMRIQFESSGYHCAVKELDLSFW